MVAFYESSQDRHIFLRPLIKKIFEAEGLFMLRHPRLANFRRA